MYTVHFQVPSLRPDLARFTTIEAAQRACDVLVNKLHMNRPIRVTVRHRGQTVFNFERK